jgi:cytochrome c oxidase cbb3-type subunit 1
MCAANAVGLWLAVCFLWPSAGKLAGAFTYGRWVPVHLNAHLYGWSSLPLVALLLAAYFPHRLRDGWSSHAVTAWSAALAFACASWLTGRTSGKLFMDWTGTSRVLFPAALALLACSLAIGLHAGWKNWNVFNRIWRLLLLLALVPVPAILYWAADPSLYPPVNPHSGGATGSSLLGSTLVLIAIFLFSPNLLSIPSRAALPRWTRILPPLLIAHFAGYLLMNRGDASHHGVGQIAGLFTLLAWPPLLVLRLRLHAWPSGTRRWLLAFAAWGIVLTVSACLMFLPGALERSKFTNAFVAHTHMAMAGMLTSFLMIVLIALNPGSTADALGNPKPFWIWQSACVLHVLSMFGAGAIEASNPGVLFGPSTGIDLLYGLRLLAGLAMLDASVRWLRAVRRGTHPNLSDNPPA